jgi:nucleoside-diphosphate-sugar epimerase
MTDGDVAASGPVNGQPAVLVTGAVGAIGCWVVRELVRRGRRVVAFDLASEPTTPFPEIGEAAVVRGDIRDAGRLGDLIAARRIERVVHLAAIVLADADPAMAIEVNSAASARLFDVAFAGGVERVVAMSTKGIFGPLEARYLHPTYDPVPIDHPPSPRGVYDSTKYLVEVAAERHRRAGADIVVARLASTFGPGKTSASHGAVGAHGDVLAAALRGESSRIDIHPDQGHDLVYYADVAAGLADLTLVDRPLKEPAYHVGSGRITTVGAFARAVEATFPGVQVETGDRFPGGRECLLDIDPTTRDAGYEPRFDIPRALEDVQALHAAGVVKG